MSIKVDAKWYPYQSYRYGNSGGNLLDFIIKGILLEGDVLKYKHKLVRTLDETDPDNMRICKKLTDYKVTPKNISDIDEIVATRKVVSEAIFTKVLEHPDIQNWLNGTSPLVIEFYNSYKLPFNYLITDETNLDEELVIPTSAYLDIRFIYNGMNFTSDNNTLTIDPPIFTNRDDAFYRKTVLDLYKLYKSYVSSRYLYKCDAEDITPGYICLTASCNNCKNRYGRYGLLQPDNNRSEDFPDFTIGNVLAWVLYNHDRCIIMDPEREAFKLTVDDQLFVEQNPNLYINDNLFNHFDIPFKVYYENPYNYGLGFADGLRFRQSILGYTLDYVDLANPDFVQQTLDSYLKDMIYNAIGFAHTPIKETMQINIMAQAFRRKHFKVKKAKGEEVHDSYADVLKALASGFMSAVKVASTIDKMYEEKVPSLDILKYMLETSEKYGDIVDNKNIHRPSHRKNFKYYINLH